MSDHFLKACLLAAPCPPVQSKLAAEQRRSAELATEVAELESKQAGLVGQLSVIQSESAEYVKKYSAAKTEAAALSRQLEEVGWGLHWVAQRRVGGCAVCCASMCATDKLSWRSHMLHKPHAADAYLRWQQAT